MAALATQNRQTSLRELAPRHAFYQGSKSKNVSVKREEALFSLRAHTLREFYSFKCTTGEKEKKSAVDSTLLEASPILIILIAGRILACLASSES